MVHNKNYTPLSLSCRYSGSFQKKDGNSACHCFWQIL